MEKRSAKGAAKPAGAAGVARAPARTVKAKAPAAKAAAGRAAKSPATARRAAGDEGCKFVAEWRMIANTRGMTQVWISTKEYKRIAAGLAKLTKSAEKRANLRARKQPIGVTHVCSGTCGGGWCKEVEIPQPGESLVTVCECAYFV